MPAKPMLDQLELQQVQKIEAEENEAVSRHRVPGLEGDFLQDLGRRAVRITLNGVLTGAEAADGLKHLREKFAKAEPVPFVADIATATTVSQVLVEEMNVRELAGKPERFEYALSVREFIAPPQPEQQTPPPVPPPQHHDVNTATLIVEVIVDGQPSFDFSKATVTVAGTQSDGTQLSRTPTNRDNNVWTEDNMPPGQYTAQAVVSASQTMSGSADAQLQAGQTTRVTIHLAPGAVIAKAFIIHYRFDSAFIEPCLREVLHEVNDYAQAHPTEKLVIIGNTDLVGTDDYNQSLSERRARGVFGFLTFSTSDDLKASALQDWNELRKPHSGGLPSLRDGWGTREYQYMLQDLGYYVGNIDEQHGPNTDAAVRAFQGNKGLQVDGIVGDDTWAALIHDYLDQDDFAIPESQFIPNAKNGCNAGIVRWLGSGEQDPVRNTQDAWRPNRRTEVLFVQANSFPCDVAKPVTFDLPAPGAGGSSWCLGPGDPNNRSCFLTRTTAQPDKWLVQPARPDTITVTGTITFDDGTPVPNARYNLMSPDGEFLHTDANGNADLGERPSGPQRGHPIPGQADENGQFSYPDQRRVGLYIMEILALDSPEVARSSPETPDEAVGNVICMVLDNA
jgi:outer membrane protein OmpA-like peptidoglycan-associated protein